MRRWMLWTLVAAVLLALGVALTQVPPAPPHEFLRNRTPIARGHQEEEARKRTLVYSFKANYVALRKAAAKELTTQGFEPWPAKESEDLDVMVLFIERRQEGSRVGLVVYNNYKASGKLARIIADQRGIPAAVSEIKTRGWVTVLVIGAHEPTWFESFRSWIGL